jgi:hypothetical protein
VTESGYRIAEKMGFDFVRDSNHDSKIMDFDVNRADIPVTEWNEDLLKIYRRQS